MGLADVALGALAAGLVEHHGAQGVVSAGPTEAAGIDALARLAGEVSRAVKVTATASNYTKGNIRT